MEIIVGLGFIVVVGFIAYKRFKKVEKGKDFVNE
jgi:hypothetical protein